MELRQLRSFVAVAEELHFRRAAERLHLSQPPLSKQIRALEDELGARLLYRTRQEVRLSPEGHVFLDRARELLSQARQAGEAVEQARRGMSGKLEVAYAPVMELRVVPRVVRQFRRRFPGVELRLIQQTSAEVSENVRRRRIDAGFLLLPTKDNGIAVERIGSDPLVLVAPGSHPLGKCPGTPLASLQGEPFVLLARPVAPKYYDLVISAARAAGVTLRIAAEARTFTEILSLVAAGLGVSVLPSAIRDIRWKGVTYCPLEAGTPLMEMAIAWRKGDESGPTRNLLTVVRELYSA